MVLNERQSEIAAAVREVANVPDNDSWGDFIDFTSAIAVMLEGNETLIHPVEMQKCFQTAWEASAKMWVGENDRILRDCLGSQEELDRVKSHPQGKVALRRILSRVREVHGNFTTGMEVKVDITDILEDELLE